MIMEVSGHMINSWQTVIAATTTFAYFDVQQKIKFSSRETGLGPTTRNPTSFPSHLFSLAALLTPRIPS